METDASRDSGSLGTVFAELEPKRQEDQADEDRIRSDQPQEAEGAGAGKPHQQNSKQNRGDPSQGQPEFSLDFFPEADGGDDLEQTRSETPGCDKQKDAVSRDLQRSEGRNTNDEAEDPFKEDNPTVVLFRPSCNRVDNQEDSIYQRPGTKEKDQGCKSQPRPCKCKYAKDQSRDSPQNQHPPIAG